MKALLALVITLTPFVPTEPTLKRLGPGDYLAINPWPRKDVFNITCGSDWELVLLPMAPKSQQEVKVVDPTGAPAVCHLASY